MIERHLLGVVVAGSTLVTTVAAGAEPAAPPVEEIVVVGSSLRVSKEEVEGGALPIQLITQEELAATGTRTIGEFLRSDPSFSGSSVGLGNGGARTTLNLRGLGQQYTLTLVNGRRTGVNGPANVARIPMEAVERIEVLKAGASAVYGADAVSGVVNIVLKSSEDGMGARARYGSADGGYDEKEYSAHFGSREDAGGFVAMVNYRETAGLAARERKVTASNDKRPLGGFDGRSGITLPAPVTLPNGQVMIINTDTVPVGSTSTDVADFRPFDFERDAHDRVPFSAYVLAPERSFSFMFSGERKLGENTRLLADVLFDRTQITMITGSSTGTFVVPATNPYNPFGVPVSVALRGLDLGVGYKYRDELDSLSGGLRLEHDLTDRLTLSMGASVSNEDWVRTTDNNYSRSGLIAALARPGLDAYNPFGNRANSPAQYAGAVVKQTYLYNEELRDLDARLTGTAWDLPTGPMQIAVGVSARNEDVHDIPPAAARIGDLMDLSVLSEYRLDRDVTAAFAEVRIPLMSARGAGESPLELGVAARYEDYSDFGGTFDPLVSLRWSPIESLGFRASYNTSFRAPYLTDLIPNENQTDITVIDPLTGLRVEAVSIGGGNPNLKPEQARTFSVGALWTPASVPGLFTSLDYYRIRQTDIIITPSPQAVLNGEIPGQVIREEDIGRGGEDLMIIAQLTNVAKRNVSGLDWLSRYNFDLRGGSQLSFNLAAHYLLTFEADQLDGRGFVSAADRYSALFTSLPRLKATGGASWTWAPLTANARVSYTSDYIDPPIEGRNRPMATVDAVTTLDLSLQLDLGALLPGLKRSSVVVGVDNVTDELPPFILARNDYDRGQHNIRGRFMYIGLETAL